MAQAQAPAPPSPKARTVRKHLQASKPFDSCPGCIDLLYNTQLPAAVMKRAACQYRTNSSYMSHAPMPLSAYHKDAVVGACGGCGTVMLMVPAIDLLTAARAADTVLGNLQRMRETPAPAKADAMLAHVDARYRQEVTDLDL